MRKEFVTEENKDQSHIKLQNHKKRKERKKERKTRNLEKKCLIDSLITLIKIKEYNNFMDKREQVTGGQVYVSLRHYTFSFVRAASERISCVFFYFIGGKKKVRFLDLRVNSYFTKKYQIFRI